MPKDLISNLHSAMMKPNSRFPQPLQAYDFEDFLAHENYTLPNGDIVCENALSLAIRHANYQAVLQIVERFIHADPESCFVKVPYHEKLIPPNQALLYEFYTKPLLYLAADQKDSSNTQGIMYTLVDTIRYFEQLGYSELQKDMQNASRLIAQGVDLQDDNLITQGHALSVKAQKTLRITTQMYINAAYHEKRYTENKYIISSASPLAPVTALQLAIKNQSHALQGLLKKAGAAENRVRPIKVIKTNNIFTAARDLDFTLLEKLLNSGANYTLASAKSPNGKECYPYTICLHVLSDMVKLEIDTISKLDKCLTLFSKKMLLDNNKESFNNLKKYMVTSLQELYSNCLAQDDLSIRTMLALKIGALYNTFYTILAKDRDHRRIPGTVLLEFVGLLPKENNTARTARLNHEEFKKKLRDPPLKTHKAPACT